MSLNIKRIKTYEEFFEDVWDYVSNYIVNDDLWDAHIDKFQELTFDLYHIYKNTAGSPALGESDQPTMKIYARIIEAFVKNFGKLFS